MPRAKLSEAEKITPGFNSPTVSAPEDPMWCAVKVMVRRGEVIEIMERLELIWRVGHSGNANRQLPVIKAVRLVLHQHFFAVDGSATENGGCYLAVCI